MMHNSGAVDPNSGEERTPQLTPSTLRFVSLFFLVVAAVFMTFILVTAESRDPYASGINLSNLEANEFVVVNQLSEVTISNIKIRHVLNAPVPLASVYGPHTVAGFAAADADMKTGEFFNFASHWAGLPDTKALLSYLKASKKLPTRTIYVGLPHPHTGTFSHLTLPMEELPPSVYLLHSGAWVGTNIRRSMRLYGGQIRDRLDWRNLAYVMTDICRPKYGILSATNAARSADTLANPNGFFALLASSIAGKAFEGRTRILVTHHAAVLPRCDLVVVMRDVKLQLPQPGWEYPQLCSLIK